MKIKYLTVEEILRVHFRLIEDYGGLHGVRDENRLSSVVSSPKLEVFGEEQYKSVYEKAAVYLRNIIGDHPFVDGNKRSAITSCVIFLARNGIEINASPSALEEFTVRVAVEHLEIDAISGWLKLNS